MNNNPFHSAQELGAGVEVGIPPWLLLAALFFWVLPRMVGEGVRAYKRKEG